MTECADNKSASCDVCGLVTIPRGVYNELSEGCDLDGGCRG